MKFSRKSKTLKMKTLLPTNIIRNLAFDSLFEFELSNSLWKSLSANVLLKTKGVFCAIAPATFEIAILLCPKNSLNSHLRKETSKWSTWNNVRWKLGSKHKLSSDSMRVEKIGFSRKRFFFTHLDKVPTIEQSFDVAFPREWKYKMWEWVAKMTEKLSTN